MTRKMVDGTRGAQTRPAVHPVELVAIADLKPHPENYQAHPEDQLAHLAESLAQHGFYRNVVIAEDNTLLAGHGIVQAAQAQGYTQVPAVRLPIAADDPEALQVLIGDNELARLVMKDDRALAELLKSLNGDDPTLLLGTGFDVQMLAQLAEQAGMLPPGLGEESPRAAVEPQIDRADELRHKWGGGSRTSVALWAPSDHLW